jgi:catechol 2,3-dioxygenase-like lactoylglutathione lyase family enzyme
MSIRLDHVNLTVRNLNESIKWYEQVFGFKKVEGGRRSDKVPWAILAVEDSMLALYEYPEKNPAPDFGDSPAHQMNHFGLRILDREAWEKTVKTHSLRVKFGGAVEYPHSTSWYVTDPSGHEIEVSFTGGAPLKFGS